MRHSFCKTLQKSFDFFSSLYFPYFPHPVDLCLSILSLKTILLVKVASVCKKLFQEYFTLQVSLLPKWVDSQSSVPI